MRRLVLVVAVLLGGAAVTATLETGAAAGDDARPERLLGNLLRARSDAQVDAALDALATRGGFADEGAFADFLGRIAEPAASHPRVRLRRGWAYVAAGRGRDAVRPLELAREEAALAPVATAYLAEARRQAGEPATALQFLCRAVELGYEEEQFLDDAAHKAGFDLRAKESARDAEWLPAYATPMDAYLALRPSAALHAAVARWILDDHLAYGARGGSRIAAWSDYGARHALAAVRAAPGIPGGVRLCLDAARALRWDEPDGAHHPLLFDCLAWAYRLGRGPDRDTHEAPQAVAWLAEVALDEGRFELAARLARERLELSDSPLAREVLAQLPLDLGE